MSEPAAGQPSPQLDPRGPRFTASVTLVVFSVVLLVAPATAGVVLLAVQTAIFAIGAGRGIQYTPTGFVFRRFVRPRLSAPTHLEDPEPPRFAQVVGLAFTVVALIGYLTGLTLLGQIATAFALAAAVLNAVFGFCLGCELYVIGHRLIGQRFAPRKSNNPTTTESNKEEVTA